MAKNIKRRKGQNKRNQRQQHTKDETVGNRSEALLGGSDRKNNSKMAI